MAYVRGRGQPGADRPGGHGAQAARDPQPQGHASATSTPSPSASTASRSTRSSLLRNLRPVITKEQAGRTLRQVRAMNAIFTALVTNTRPEVALQFSELKPSVTRGSFGPVIVIRRGSNRLYLYKGMRFQRVFGVATGQSVYPTPLGQLARSSSSGGTRGGTRRTRRGRRARSRSRRARATRSARAGWACRRSGVGIHGTPDDASIGYSASHGCIRMHIPDAEWLFNHVTVGTPVFIVSA